VTVNPSIVIAPSPAVRYLLRIGDTCLVLAQRLGEWCGHAPALEEDIAMANIALDLLGQARAVLAHAGAIHARVDGLAFDEDQLAFLRDERDYLNVTLVELPNGTSGRGDFAFTTLRNFVMATFLRYLWHRLEGSSDEALAAIAAKAVKEARYHQTHSAEWVVRLGDGTDESRRRLDAARERVWPYVDELFASDDIDDAAEASGLGPRWSELHAAWLADVAHVFDEATLRPPAANVADAKTVRLRGTGKTGRHSEHMGFLLAEMQHLQRAYPGGVW
jgi:ring-1,2-phenylacetyl-CoA epoxidase subunit PaaC